MCPQKLPEYEGNMTYHVYQCISSWVPVLSQCALNFSWIENCLSNQVSQILLEINSEEYYFLFLGQMSPQSLMFSI